MISVYAKKEKNKRCKKINIRRKEKEKNTKILRRNKDASVHVAAFCVINIVVPSRRIQETSYWAAEAKTAQKNTLTSLGVGFMVCSAGDIVSPDHDGECPFLLTQTIQRADGCIFYGGFCFNFY